MDDQTQEQSQQVDAPTLRWAMKKLGAAFPASFPDEAAIEDKAVLWRELLDQHPWITRDIFVAAVFRIAWTHMSDFLPPPPSALMYLRDARDKVAREAQKALPPPAPRPTETQWDRMNGPERAAFLERHIAIGKLRARAGAIDLNVPFEASEEAIAGVIGELRATGFMRRQLERAAAGELVSPGDLIEGGMKGRL